MSALDLTPHKMDFIDKSEQHLSHTRCLKYDCAQGGTSDANREDAMAKAALVPDRSTATGLAKLGMRSSDTELVDFWVHDKPETRWLAGNATFLGAVPNPSDLKSHVRMSTQGTCSIATLSGEAVAILAPHSDSSPALWLTFSLSEIKVTPLGSAGLINKRPEKVMLELPGAVLVLSKIASHDPPNFSLNKELEFLELLAGRSYHGQTVGTESETGSRSNQGLVSISAPVEAAAPVFEDPEDALRYRLLQSVLSSLTDMANNFSLCFEKAENVENAFALANAEYVDGVRHHEISRSNFRSLAINSERELEGLLRSLREATTTAQRKWDDLAFLLPGPDGDLARIGKWCMAQKLDSDVMSSVYTNCVYLRADFGLTKESFWAENDRLVEVLKNATS